MKKFITMLVVIIGIAGFSTLHAADLHGIVTEQGWEACHRKGGNQGCQRDPGW